MARKTRATRVRIRVLQEAGQGKTVESKSFYLPTHGLHVTGKQDFEFICRLLAQLGFKPSHQAAIEEAHTEKNDGKVVYLRIRKAGDGGD